jgi:hypothetical protein
VRIATLAVVTLGAMVSWTSARDVYIALEAPGSDLPELDGTSMRFLTPEQQPIFKDALKASVRAQLSAIEGMQRSRVAILILLSMAATMVFTAALRLRWNLGGGRIFVTKQLGVAAVVCAVLRTLDGAQELAIVGQAFGAAEKVFEKTPLPGPQLPVEIYRTLGQAASIGFTVFVVACFLLAGGYLRSARVQQIFAGYDAQAPDEED